MNAQEDSVLPLHHPIMRWLEKKTVRPLLAFQITVIKPWIGGCCSSHGINGNGIEHRAGGNVFTEKTQWTTEAISVGFLPFFPFRQRCFIQIPYNARMGKFSAVSKPHNGKRNDGPSSDTQSHESNIQAMTRVHSGLLFTALNCYYKCWGFHSISA